MVASSVVDRGFEPRSGQTKDEEGQFKADIAEVYQAIKGNHARTLGEYLFNLEVGKVKLSFLSFKGR
jgi:hypothetical protein